MNDKNFLSAQCRCGSGGYLVPVERNDESSVPIWTRPEVIANATPASAPPRTLRVATHEAAHAAVIHVLGFGILSITADGQPHCAHGPIRDHAARAAIALAGDHGERLILHRCEYRPYCSDVVASFEVVRELKFGGCDRCTAAFSIFGALGSGATNEALLSAYRSIEADVIALIREPLVRGVIRGLADRLLEVGNINGAEVHHFFEDNGVAHGSRRVMIGEISSV